MERADLDSAHPDQALVRLVERAGLTTQFPAPDNTLRMTGTARDGLVASGKECPDLLPTLAALACVLPRPSTLTDVGVLRLKESDRLEGIRTLVAAFGGTTAPGGRDADNPPSYLPSAALLDGQPGRSPPGHGRGYALRSVRSAPLPHRTRVRGEELSRASGGSWSAQVSAFVLKRALPRGKRGLPGCGSFLLKALCRL